MATKFSIQDNKSWKTTYFIIRSGQALYTLGSQLVRFALTWCLAVQMGSATEPATASLTGMLPKAVVSSVRRAI